MKNSHVFKNNIFFVSSEQMVIHEFKMTLHRIKEKTDLNRR